ncbi:MAG: SRPBCC family protein [Pyrinomonadaceae bacterium]
MIKKILIGLAAIVVILVVVIALQPATYQVERSATIAAPASVVFAQVNDFRKWNAWSPWAKLDPAMKQTFEGASAGPGAVYTWTGNKDVGEGRMTITESHASDLVRIKLEFLKPFAATSATEFTFTPQGDQTAVKWKMSGENNFMAKAFSLFMNMDKMIGGDFEKGLAQMKSVAEAAPKQ